MRESVGAAVVEATDALVGAGESSTSSNPSTLTKNEIAES
jgi:hypothetical protein